MDTTRLNKSKWIDNRGSSFYRSTHIWFPTWWGRRVDKFSSHMKYGSESSLQGYLILRQYSVMKYYPWQNRKKNTFENNTFTSLYRALLNHIRFTFRRGIANLCIEKQKVENEIKVNEHLVEQINKENKLHKLSKDVSLTWNIKLNIRGRAVSKKYFVRMKCFFFLLSKKDRRFLCKSLKHTYPQGSHASENR